MTTATPAAQNSAGKTVRRFIVYVLLFVLVTIAAIGVAGLLARAVDGGVLLASGDNSGLATSLAFTLIAGPLAAVLWWFTWRGLADWLERDSTLWGLYLAGMSTLALILGVSFVLTTVSTLVAGTWDYSAFAAGVAWLAVWAWHWWMAHHRLKSPTRIAAGARILGYTFGLAVGSIAAVQAIAALIDLAVSPSTGVAAVGYPWWLAVVQATVWALGGAAVWWLHWLLDRGSRARTGFASVMLALVTGLWAAGLTLAGMATAVYVGVRLVAERSEPIAEVLEPLGFGLGAAGIGAVLWGYYRLQLPAAAPAARRGARLLSAGVAVVAAATGIGIVVNSTLAAIVAPLAESDSRSLLFAGLSLLVVGGPAWWLIWKPLTAPTVELARETGRRVYLITVFGVSALVAIITLLVIGYQVFDFVLAGGSGDSLLDRVRASLGLLVATALVAMYHFSAFRRDRAQLPVEGVLPQSISRVVLVMGCNADAAVSAIRVATGAAVTVWPRADETAAVAPIAIVAALEGVTGARVLVLVGPKGVQVIPLES